MIKKIKSKISFFPFYYLIAIYLIYIIFPEKIWLEKSLFQLWAHKEYFAEHFQFILSSVKTIGRKWRAIAKKFYGSFGVVVDDMKSTNLIKRQFYNACKAIKVPFDNDRYCFCFHEFLGIFFTVFVCFCM